MSQTLAGMTSSDLETVANIYNRMSEFGEEHKGKIMINHTRLLELIKEETSLNINGIHTLVRRAIELRNLLQPERDTAADLWVAMRNSTDDLIVGQAMRIQKLLGHEPQPSEIPVPEATAESLSGSSFVQQSLRSISGIPAAQATYLSRQGLETIGQFIIYQTLFPPRGGGCYVVNVGDKTMDAIEALLEENHIQLPLAPNALRILLENMHENELPIIGQKYLDGFKIGNFMGFTEMLDFRDYTRAREYARIAGENMSEYLDDTELTPRYISLSEANRKKKNDPRPLFNKPVTINIVANALTSEQQKMKLLADLLEDIRPENPWKDYE